MPVSSPLPFPPRGGEGTQERGAGCEVFVGVCVCVCREQVEAVAGREGLAGREGERGELQE